MLLKVVTDIFQEVGKDVGPFGEKKNFWKFFSPSSLQNQGGCFQREVPKAAAFPFGKMFTKKIFFPLVSKAKEDVIGQVKKMNKS